MTLKWIDHPNAEESHKVWQFLVDGEDRVLATVERFSDEMPTYANVYHPRRERRVVSLYDYGERRAVPSIAAQDQQARDWCVAVVRPN